MTNIAFAKIGKSIKFKTAYSHVGGDNEAPAVVRAIANNNPDKKIYIIGRSDFDKLTEIERVQMFPYDNVVNVWSACKTKTYTNKHDYNDPFFQHIGNYFKENDIKIDFGVMMVGQVGNVVIPGKIRQIRKPDEIASIIDMSLNYSAPIAIWLNEYKVPYVEVINDPRYTMAQARDIFHMPSVSLGQFNWMYEFNSIKSYEDQERQITPMESVYAGMEKAFLVGRKRQDVSKLPKSRTFCVVLNEGEPSRYNMLNDWVLSNMDDVEVYGRWEHPKAQSEVDSRFRGSVYLEDAQKIMSETKYTLIIPIREGWVTSKYIEMIHAGVIPFLHPTYDMQGHIQLPKILRPATADAMFKSIEKLESTPGAREALLELLSKSILTDDLYSGKAISDSILEAGHKQIGRDYAAVDVSKFAVKRVASLDDFF